MILTKDTFIKSFLSEITENNAAIFAGAGFSLASGSVDWKTLLKDMVTELNLDVHREDDLVAAAQYYVNETAGGKNDINQLIANKFHHGVEPNINHEILSRLPISTYWTTNYDQLIEKSLRNVGKIVDAKVSTDDLAITIRGRDAIVYKMHGDVDQPGNTILIRQDYEEYYRTHDAYIRALSGDLVSKTFLFLGFSFADPNLNYILSRVRVELKDNPRKHYYILKSVCEDEYDVEDEYNYQRIKQQYFINDLKRYGIETLLVDSYREITDILSEIERIYRNKTVYISGSAEEYGELGPEAYHNFISKLSGALIKEGCRIVTGVGKGIGDSVISGALNQIYNVDRQQLHDQLVLRPFPRGNSRDKALWESYRRDMINYSGISIFLLGNKLKSEKIENADGVYKEYEISEKQGNILLPIGATGYMAEELWKNEKQKMSETNPSNSTYLEHFDAIGNSSLALDEIQHHTIELIKQLIK